MHHPGYQLRVATVEDIDSIANVIRTVFEEYGFTWQPGGYHRDLFELKSRYLEDANSTFLVATSPNQEVVGTAGLEAHQLPTAAPGDLIAVDGDVRIGGTQAEVVRMYILPDHRRRGIARKLLQKLIEHARSRKMTALEIWSDVHFREAHRLYESEGARHLGRRQSNDPDQSIEAGFILLL